MENIEKIIRQQLTEAVYSSVSGQKLPLSYSIGFQPKKNLKTGTIQNFAYLNLKLQDPTDALTLKDKFHAELKKGSNTEVFYRLNADSPDAFLNGTSITGAYTYLEKTGKYIMPDLNIIKAEISQAKFDNVDPAIKKEQNDAYEGLFEKILRSLNDPTTQAMLQSISRIGFDINEKVYGSVKSPNNVIKVFAVKPDATFVTTRKLWRNYNRILKGNPTPIYLTVPITTGHDSAKAETELGVKYQDIKDNPHKKDAYRIQSTTGLAGFSTYVAFDVSDTMVIPGYEDLWTGKAGMVDNLKGVLNQMAQEELGLNKINSDNLNIKTDENQNKLFTTRFISYLNANRGIIPSNTLQSLSSMDPGQDSTVVAILKTYYSNYAFEREHDPRMKDAKVYAAIAATLTAENLAETEKLKIIKIHENNIKNILTQRQDFVSISMPVTKVCNIIKKVNESIMITEKTVSPEDIMSLFNINPESLDNNENVTEDKEEDIETKEQIKENFYKLFNKIDKK